MEYTGNRCVLWVGDKHSGKTTAATKLVKSIQQQGYTVGGVLAPSIYKEARLVGFDIFDIKNELRIPLAVREDQEQGFGAYRYFQEGLKVGHSALSCAENRLSNLVVVDEYGPWELSGDGWRADVDSLLMESRLPVLLVVRRQIVDEVRELYERHNCFTLEALDSDSVARVLGWLKG
jgi:nucleoside-triphosphatase THEP1